MQENALSRVFNTVRIIETCIGPDWVVGKWGGEGKVTSTAYPRK